MIATLDKLKALGMKLEDLQARIVLDSLNPEVQSGKRKAMAPVILDTNETALLRRLTNDYLEESEELLAVGQLQNYD